VREAVLHDEEDFDPPELTEIDVKGALRWAADGANELNKLLREVFVLTEASANLLLR
jgi:hypothetical protein